MNEHMDRVEAREAALELETGKRSSVDVIEIGMDDPRSPAQIRRDAEKNGGNPRMPTLDKGIGIVASGNINITPVSEQSPE